MVSWAGYVPCGSWKVELTRHLKATAGDVCPEPTCGFVAWGAWVTTVLALLATVGFSVHLSWCQVSFGFPSTFARVRHGGKARLRKRSEI